MSTERNMFMHTHKPVTNIHMSTVMYMYMNTHVLCIHSVMYGYVSDVHIYNTICV